MKITVAHSPDSDDAFMFYGLASGAVKVDGIEVLLQRGRTSGLDQVPVVVMTSSDEERHVLASYHLGIHGYLAKPLNLDDVADTVSKIGIS